MTKVIYVMDNLKELMEYLMVLREEKIPPHTILDSAVEEFSFLFDGSRKGEYYGLQLDGKEAIFVTYYDETHNIRVESQIALK